jgi:hypothetical protein
MAGKYYFNIIFYFSSDPGRGREHLRIHPGVIVIKAFLPSSSLTVAKNRQEWLAVA